jgi:hypothetical protein
MKIANNCPVAGHTSAGYSWTETLPAVCESDTDAGCGVKAWGIEMFWVSFSCGLGMICDHGRDQALTRRFSSAAARALACASHLPRGYMKNHRVNAERKALGSRVSGSKRFSCLLRWVARKKENAKAGGREGAGAGGPADVIKRPSLTYIGAVKSEGAMGAVVMAVCWASFLVEGPLAESTVCVAWWLCGYSRLMLLL